MLELNKLYNMDCMEGMKQFPDKYFELAIVDPPYGIGAGSNKFKNGTSRNDIGYKVEDWDKQIPKKEYFKELFRVSNNQIIWGANYMTEYLFPSKSWIFWDKGTGDNSYSDGELAWTSFGSVVKKIFISWVGANAKERQEMRIHPTQKPVALYEWLLTNYANTGDKILDTHVGSASSLIACYNLGFNYIGFEIDKDYYNMAQKRLDSVKNQIRFA